MRRNRTAGRTGRDGARAGGVLDDGAAVGPGHRHAEHEERRVAELHGRRPRHQVLAARPDQRRRTSTSSKSRGASRPTTSARVPSSSSKARRSMVKGVLYTTAGTRRSVVALDGRTGELIWSHSYREGKRAAIAPRQLSGRGVSYWTDGKGDERILYVTTGYRLVALNAKNGAHGPVVRRRRRRRSEERRRVRQRPADRSGDRRDRPALDADHRQGRRHRRLLVQGGHDGQDAQQHEGPGARVRRADRQAAVDVQHDSAARRVRQRHVGERLVGDQRQHRRVDADHGRRRSRPRVPAGRDADLGLLRRPSSRQQPVRREPRRASI